MDDDHLTEPNAELAKLRRQTPHGMMHWSGTGPDKTTCGMCQHFGYWYTTRPNRTHEKPHACALYWKHMHKHPVEAINPGTPSCKYFERRPDGDR
jgi:hypothetical protein